KLNKTYTESETENFLSSGKSIYWFDAIRWPVADFVKTFFHQKGYKDGMHGLVLYLFQAFYALVFFAKVWERKENFRDLFTVSHSNSPDRHSNSPDRHPETPSRHPERSEGSHSEFFSAVIKEFSKAARDVRYWIYEALMAENPAKKIYYKIRRKFR
ncbi:hypothetical protein HYZ70_01135, partial [Candidatus Curtissbacteria bacterium]|nr:hypothetical protein [Candidatus Curtissbacteria bacterium]